MKKKARTFSDYWSNSKQEDVVWIYNDNKGSAVTNGGVEQIKKMCRNAYNAGLREGKKKRPRAVKQ